MRQLLTSLETSLRRGRSRPDKGSSSRSPNGTVPETSFSERPSLGEENGQGTRRRPGTGEVVQTVNPAKTRNNENFCPKNNNKYYPYPEYHCGHGDSSPEQSCKLCGSSSPFSNELGISDKGPVGPKHGEGLLHRFPHSPEPAQKTTGPAIQSEPTGAVETGSRVLSDESFPPEGGYFSNLFLVPKKDGGQRP